MDRPWTKTSLFACSTFLLGVLLTACAGSDSGGGCDSSGVTGEPDMTSAPSFVSGSVTRGDTISVKIPVDSLTGYVSVNLYSADRSNYAGGGDFTVSSPAEQTITVDISTSLGTPLDDYFPLINICTDFGSCTSSAGSLGIGVAYTTDDLSSPGPDYARTKYYDAGSVSVSSQTCMPVPYVTVHS